MSCTYLTPSVLLSINTNKAMDMLTQFDAQRQINSNCLGFQKLEK